MFIRTNDKIVNLKNVSNINVVHERNRIVFNLNYSISMDNYKYISDYVYWDAEDESQFIKNLSIISIHVNELNFIVKLGDGWINADAISSIKFRDRKRRIIINLSHNVTFVDYNDDEKITSEFVYIDCKSDDEYSEYVNYITKRLNIK
jgi:hypothetical protein